MLGRLFSLIGLSWGNGGVEFFNADVPVVYPPYGTVIATYNNYEYPVAQGGQSFIYNGTTYPNQTVTVNLIADGSGGSILNWAGVTNLAYKPDGTVFTATSGVYTINVGGIDYQSGTFVADVAHDGLGWYTNINAINNYTASGTFIAFVYSPHGGGSLEVPFASGNYYNNGTYDGYDYYHDGNGSTYTQDAGTFTVHSAGYFYADGPALTTEVPSMSGNYYNNGANTTYVADGTGGYTTGVGGSYIAIGTVIFDIISGSTGNYIEVPTGSTLYYYDQFYGDRYVWDGAGGYYQYTGQFYFVSGTFIGNDGNYNWYWDGVGGYYST